MATAILDSERNRDLLSHTIIDILKSWPAVQREVFIRAHYWGDPVEAISRSLLMTVGEVRFMLEQCDRRLCSALRPFRTDAPAPEPAALPGFERRPRDLYC